MNEINDFAGSEWRIRKWVLCGAKVYLGLMFGRLFGANGW